MNETSDRIEVRRLRRMLRELADIAQHASLTGSLSGGAPGAIRRYNAAVRRLEELGAISPGMFEQLETGTSFDELGVESKLLVGSLEEYDLPEPPMPPMPPPPPGAPHGNVVIGLGGLKELNDLRDLGKVIRDQFPAWMRGHEGENGEQRERERAERERERAERERERAERERDRTAGSEEANRAARSQMEGRLVEIGVKMQSVAEQMRRGDLSEAQRAELADQLSRLGQEQTDLIRQHTVLREG